MADALLWVVGAAAVALGAAAWETRRNRRAARAVAATPCPRCGRPFGPGADALWVTHTRTTWRCVEESGPHPRCRPCGVRFRYTRSGHLHPEPFEAPAAEAGPPTDRAGFGG